MSTHAKIMQDILETIDIPDEVTIIDYLYSHDMLEDDSKFIVESLIALADEN